MSGFRIADGAGHRLDEIYAYTRDAWGEAQADVYIRHLFDCFESIAARRFPWRQIPAELGVDGYFRRCQKHFIHWKPLDDGVVGIVTILHERMHRAERLEKEFSG